MNSIVKAKQEDFQLLCDMGKKSFIESHGDSASETDINEYAIANYNSDKSGEELSDDKNIYYIIHHNARPAGYSKIILITSTRAYPWVMLPSWRGFTY